MNQMQEISGSNGGQQPFEEFRLVVVGPPVVGKSALTIRLTQSEFANEYDPTIEDSYRYYCEISGIKSSLDILDTAGQEEYSSMRDMYMKTGEGFLLVFSLTDRQSFDEISSFYNQINRVKGELVDFVPMILVGNKSDLVEERQVSEQEAINLAKSYNSAYIETSAKSGVNVTDAFHNVVKMIIGNNFIGVGLQSTLFPSKSEELEAQKLNAVHNSATDSTSGKKAQNNNHNLLSSNGNTVNNFDNSKSFAGAQQQSQPQQQPQSQQQQQINANQNLTNSNVDNNDGKNNANHSTKNNSQNKESTGGCCIII